jgi:rhomboid protease GluP
MNDWPKQPPDEAPDRPPVIAPDMLADDAAPDGPIDFERGMSYLPPVTLALILANILVFGWELRSGALANADAIVAAGALLRQRVLQGEIWRLLTAMFLHGSPEHLIGNCLILYVVGMACEHAFGWQRAALVYFASGLCGSLLSVTFHPGPSLGASGAIFGVLGGVVVFFYRYQRAILLRDKRIGFVLLIWALYSIGSGFLDPFTDNFAHVGGLVGGTLLTLLLRPTLIPRPKAATHFQTPWP